MPILNLNVQSASISCPELNLNGQNLQSIVRRVYQELSATSRLSSTPEREQSVRNSSLEEEISRYFSTPRGRVSTHAQTSSQNVVPPCNPGYNPLLNYGNSGSKGKWKGKLNKKCPASRPTTKSASVITKELILLPTPNYDEVPWFAKKRNEAELRKKVRKLFVCV